MLGHNTGSNPQRVMSICTRWHSGETLAGNTRRVGTCDATRYLAPKAPAMVPLASKRWLLAMVPLLARHARNPGRNTASVWRLLHQSEGGPCWLKKRRDRMSNRPQRATRAGKYIPAGLASRGAKRGPPSTARSPRPHRAKLEVQFHFHSTVATMKGEAMTNDQQKAEALRARTNLENIKQQLERFFDRGGFFVTLVAVL